VAPSFGDSPERRAAARREFGVGEGERLVVIVAGSWGIGQELAGTVAAIAGSGRYRVMTVCGSDNRLRRRLVRQGLGGVLGWTDRMPALLAAADVVVENAGGLTSLEAFAAGVPIVTFRPIPGHGRDNVRGMVAAGVTTAPVDHAGLLEALDRLSVPGEARDHQVAAGRALFADDPVDHILALLP